MYKIFKTELFVTNTAVFIMFGYDNRIFKKYKNNHPLSREPSVSSIGDNFLKKGRHKPGLSCNILSPIL